MQLEIQAIKAGYGTQLVLDGVEFTVPEKSVITLLGANGCGKSTLLKIIGRILTPYDGCVLLDGKAVQRYGTLELARRIAVLPQLHHASGDITVEELIAFGRFPHRKSWRICNKHDRKVIDEAVNVTRLGELRKRPVASLSGGERQRAWIAMTLAQEPEILLLDEPTTFLDVCCQFEIIEVVKELNRQRGITVIMVLHDLNQAARCSDLLITMKNRKVMHIGAPREIMKPEILREIFEIESEVTVGRDSVPYCLPTGSCRKHQGEKQHA